MVVRQTKLTTLLTTDMWWQKKPEKLAKFRVLDKIPEGIPLFLKIYLNSLIAQCRVSKVK